MVAALALPSRFYGSVDPKVAFTLYSSLTNSTGESRASTTQELIQLFTTPIEAQEKKDVILFGPYSFNREQRRAINREHRRANKNVGRITLLSYDIDNAKSKTFDEVVDLLKVHQCVIHTTHSNCSEQLKVRVIFFLTRSIAPDEYSAVWLKFAFFAGLKDLIDPACKDISRAYFLFSYPSERKNLARCFVNLGAPVNPDLYLKKRSVSPLSAFLPKATDMALVKEGGRNSALATLVGRFISQGLTTKKTLEEAFDWNNSLEDPLDDDEVKRTHDSIWKTHLRNHPEAIDGVVSRSDIDYSFVRAFDLLSTPPVPRRYLLDQFLMERVVSLLIAPGGTGKSMLSLLIAVCVASGISLFDRFQAKAPRRVLFISGEDDLEELKRRLFKILVDESTEVRTLVAQNLVFIDFADKFELFTEKPIQGEIRITDVPEKIIESLKQHIGDDIALVIVDPAARFRGGDENLAADATRFVQALQLIRDRLSCAVLAVHHVNKAARGAASGQNNARGSSAFIDGVRLVYELSALSEQEIAKRYGSLNVDTQLLNLTCVKTNYGKRIEPLLLERRENGTLAAASRLPENLQLTLILREIKSCPMSKSAFKERYGGIEKKFRISEKVLLRKIDELQEKGLLNVPSRSSMMVTRNGEEFITNGQSGKERERSES